MTKCERSCLNSLAARQSPARINQLCHIIKTKLPDLGAPQKGAVQRSGSRERRVARADNRIRRVGPLTACLQSLGQPHLYHGLACHAQMPRLAIERFQHPDWKLDVDAFLLLARAARLRQVKRIQHTLALIKFLIKFRGFHNEAHPRFWPGFQDDAHLPRELEQQQNRCHVSHG